VVRARAVTSNRRSGPIAPSTSASSIGVVQYEARIEVTQRPGVLDPQGATVERALPALGYRNVRDVQIGKCIRLVVDAPDRDNRPGRRRDDV